MSKIDVIKVDWVNETEVHIYPPGGGHAWWARPMPKYNRDGEVWELHGADEDELEGYFDDLESMFEHVSEHFDSAPIVVTKERE